VVDAGGGAPTTIATDAASGVNWSSDGGRIAFSRSDGIWVVDVDGSGLQQIVPGAPGVSDPVWSPDGTRLLFAKSNGGNFPLFDTFVVDVSSRVVTPLTFDIRAGQTSSQPNWSPDGSWISVQRSTGTQGLARVMNADGTCARDLPGPIDEVFWQPVPGGPRLARYSCHALRVSASAVSGTATSVEFRITIQNSGTEPLSGVRLKRLTGTDLTPTSVRSTDASCWLRGRPGLCWVGLLNPGQKAEVEVRADGRRAVGDPYEGDWLTTKVAAQANEALTDADAASFQYSDFLSRCTTKTRGGGLVEGTANGELVCGRRGSDRIEPSWGRDRVRAGAGNDIVLARDDARDAVSCGPGKDLVYADRRDVVGRDCERVRRAR
jgi:WD40-like Beta Propeller Repeat